MADLRTLINLVEQADAGFPEGASGLTFFHGTSSTRLLQIMKHGLKPQTSPQSFNRGNGSTIQGWTENHVFLAAQPSKAMIYAESEAKHTGGKPVVLNVRVSDLANLQPDDDFIIDYVIREMAKLNGWEEGSDESPDEMCDNATGIVSAMNIVFTAGLPEIADAAYQDIDYARLLLQAAQRATRASWRQSLQHNEMVAYRGVIPPENISFVTPE